MGQIVEELGEGASRGLQSRTGLPVNLNFRAEPETHARASWQAGSTALGG